MVAVKASTLTLTMSSSERAVAVYKRGMLARHACFVYDRRPVDGSVTSSESIRGRAEKLPRKQIADVGQCGENAELELKAELQGSVECVQYHFYRDDNSESEFQFELSDTGAQTVLGRVELLEQHNHVV